MATKNQQYIAKFIHVFKKNFTANAIFAKDSYAFNCTHLFDIVST